MPTRRARLLVSTLSSLCSIIIWGQESPQRPDTLAIPLDFEVNGKPAGEITVEADSSLQSIAIDMAALKGKLQSLEDIEYNRNALESLPDGYVPISEVQANGIDIALDLERLVVHFTAEVSKSVDRSNRQRIRFGYQTPVERDDHHVDEAQLSAYANFNIRSTRLKNELGVVTDSQRMAIEHVFNYKGFALEGDSAWNSGSQYQLNRIRLVKDLPGQLQRVVFGDLSTPIKNPQRGFQLWGASLFKEFDLQPYRTFTPTSSATFELDENATVQMQMNGRPSRTLKLSPGVYDIEQFKLAAGLNTMDLEIVTDSGSVERIQVNSFGEPTLLDKGVSTYALSIGLPSTNSSDSGAFILSDASWYSRQLSPNPVLSGYYQKGLTDQLTANVNLQANDSWSRLGGESTWVNAMGSFNINLGFNSTSTHRSGARIGGDWKRSLVGYQVAISGYYATDGFERVLASGQKQDRSLQNSFSLRVGKRFGDRASANLGILHQKRRLAKSEQSFAFNFGYRFPQLHLGLLARYSNRTIDKGLSSFLTLTWNPRENWRSRTRFGFASVESEDGLSTNIDYSTRRIRSSTNANLNHRESGTGREIDGRLRYETDRYAATVSRAHLYRDINDYSNKGIETSLSGEFALAYADGAIGLTRRVPDSFAIIANHEAWSDVELGINPTLGGFEQKTRSGLLKPVLTDLQSYRESQAIVRPLNMDAFLETDQYHFLPTYRRGTKLTIGDEYVYTLRSSLAYWNEQPAAYKTLKVSGEDISEILTFTNSSGKFIVTGLKPGSYTIRVNGAKETATIVIDGRERMVFIDKILLSDPNTAQ